MSHEPVLLQEVLQTFREQPKPLATFLEGTFGRGGHTRALFSAFAGLKVTAFDRDEAAIIHGRKAFSAEINEGRLEFIHDDFGQIAQKGIGRFDGLLLDLGVSSPQFDDAERGFSFQHDGPLDMRMDKRDRQSAANLVNELSEKQLSDLFFNYGEVRHPNRVVRAIVHDRKTTPFETTRQLASLIERVDGVKRVRGRIISSATPYFMALRIAVNGELESLERFLEAMPSHLNDGGRCAIISFHSLEDRIVKHAFRSFHKRLGLIINKKVIMATPEEVDRNPRSRSAKMRVFEKGELQ